ncbi:MAG TPA: tetratricopeptide repeat protein [Granulicella sp.]
MPIISLSDATSKIHRIVRQRQEREERSPFFFIVGAGVSAPEIPLAGEIEEHCRNEAARDGNTTPPDSARASDTYSYWFSSAYPSAADRQFYLRSLMEKKSISKANLRLAHLVLDGTIARTVFTPNFDDMLTKALQLFGQRPLVCDHPLTVGRMRIDAEDIQIIHVHGSYWFYDCCNLTQDIADRAGSAPMSLMLDGSLRDHAPLVIGYSGWESDILMSAIRRRLQTGLSTPIFWFCYSQDSFNNLPLWLRKNEHGQDRTDILFVMPEKAPSADPAAGSRGVRSSAASAEPVSPGGTAGPTAAAPASGANAVHKAGEQRSRGGLSADVVLDALVRRFDLPVPPLTENPLAFYARQLRELLGVTDQENADQDTFYGFHTVIARVERARVADANKAPETLQSFREAMSKADYRRAIEIAQEFKLAKLPVEQLRELHSALWDASVGLLDNSDDELAGYDLVIQCADLLPGDASAQINAARAFVNKGITLAALNRGESAIAAFDQMLQRHSASKDLAILEQVGKALFNKGAYLGRLGRNEEAIKAYQETEQLLSGHTDVALSSLVARAILNQGVSARILKHPEEAIKIYDDLLQRFSSRSEPVLQEQVALALRNKGVALSSLGRNEEAIASYDDLLLRFASACEPPILEQISAAMLNKGVVLGTINRSEEAVAVYDDLLRRFRDSPEALLQEQVACALRNKGVELDNLNRGEEAIAVYDDLLQRYQKTTAGPITEQLAKALLNKGVTLGSLGRNEEAIAVYTDLAHRFGDQPEMVFQEQVARGLRNKGVALDNLQRYSEAVEVYDDVVNRYNGSISIDIQEQVAGCLRNKGVCYAHLDDGDSEIASYDDLIHRFQDSPEPGVRAEVAHGIYYKGLTLEGLDRKPEAVATYDDLLARFDKAPEPIIQGLLDKARESRKKLQSLAGV